MVIIESKIKKFLAMKGDLKKLSINSRNYVEKYHAYELIAEKYVESKQVKIASNY